MKWRAAAEQRPRLRQPPPCRRRSDVRDHDSQHCSGRRENHAFGQENRRHLYTRCAQRTHDREVVSSLVQCLRECDEKHQRRRGDQQPRERANQVDAGTENGEESCGFVRRRCGDQFRFLVNRARQARCGQRGTIFDQSKRHFAASRRVAVRAGGRERAALPVAGVASIVIARVLMHGPHTGQRREHEPVQYSARGRQQARHGIARVRMLSATFGEAVRPDEPVADAHLQSARDLAAQYGIERQAPEGSLHKLTAVMPDKIRLRPDNAKSTETVAQCQRYHLRDQRIPAQCVDRVQRNVSRRNIRVIDARQNNLQRTALGADDQVDAGGVTGQARFEFARDEQRQRDRGHSQCKHDYHQQRRQGAAARIGPCKPINAH